MEQYEQKKQVEWLLADCFRLGWDNFPAGKLEASESPDFILSSGNKHKTGIELTRLHPKSKPEPTEEELEQKTIRDDLIARSCEFFELKTAQKCFVKFIFSESETIREEQVFSWSVKIAGRISENTKHLKKGKLNQIILKKDLPPAVELILVLTHPLLKFNVWEESNNLGISTNLADDIQYTIHKKDEKLTRLYSKQHLDEYWLLIITDKLQQKNLINTSGLINRSGFESRFRRVFILELIPGNVTEIV